MSQEPKLPKDEVDFNLLAQSVFKTEKGKIYIGGKEISREMRDVLYSESQYLLQSRFWELYSATIVNEAADLALLQSGAKTGDIAGDVKSAKMLYYSMKVFATMMMTLAKEPVT